MESAAQTRRLVRLKQRRARSELRLAALRKRERALDAHVKFRLGALTEIVGWDELELSALEKLNEALLARLKDSSESEVFRIAGANWLERNKANGKEPEPVPGRWGSSPDGMRARAHHLITIGGLFVRDGLDTVDRATLLGAMFDLDAARHAPRTAAPLEAASLPAAAP